MLKQELLQQYKKDVENLRKCAKQLNLTDEEITEIFRKCFKTLKSKQNELNHAKSKNKAQNYSTIILKILIILIIILIIIYIILNVHQPTTSIVLRNVQGLIYPGFKFLRFLSVPIIKQFPQLTGFYDESCLVENPYFYVADMECWPCENVNTVIDLTNYNNYSLYQQSGIPYIIKNYQQKQIDFKQLQHEYYRNQQIYNRDANNLKSNDQKLRNLIDFFDKYQNLDMSSNLHVQWRINRMLPGRLLRKYFQSPKNRLISDRLNGQSIERYILIDGKLSESYQLPNTECSGVFVVQGSGERIIILKPSKECGDKCRTVSVILKPSHVFAGLTFEIQHTKQSGLQLQYYNYVLEFLQECID